MKNRNKSVDMSTFIITVYYFYIRKLYINCFIIR
uniref:Uncharacterized protein n=1 Tax=Heterorhabditis bacteriophora TaxID=37862 RepID=A0A1I7WD41_HETBA